MVFRVGVNRRLYALKPGVEQDEKVRITNKAELEEIFKYIDENEEFMDALQVLYVYPEDLTPQSLCREKRKVILSRVIAPHTRRDLLEKLPEGMYRVDCVVEKML